MSAAIKKDAGLIGKEFVITREYDAPRELVWQACTEANHLARWWGPEGFTAPVCEWDAKPGNKIYVVMRAPDGMRYPMGGEFLEVVPLEKLVTITGALDENGDLMFEFHHTLTLIELGGKTGLTMRSRLVQVVAPDAAKYIGGFEAGMTQSLDRLAGVLEKMPFAIERTFDAPVALVWRAITNCDDLAKWYFELKDFKPEVGCEFRFVVEHEGDTYDHRCKVTELVPHKKLAYIWRYEGHSGDSLVTFELFPEGGKTRLKLTHQGLETFPKLPAFARKNFTHGWTEIIGSMLKNYVESAKMRGREITSARTFDFPREAMFNAFSDPGQLALWWGPKGFTSIFKEFDLKPGGWWRFVMHGPDGATYENNVQFSEVVSPDRIVFQHLDPVHRFQMTMSFVEDGGKTRLIWRMVFESAEEFCRVGNLVAEANEQNFDRLATHLAKKL